MRKRVLRYTSVLELIRKGKASRYIRHILDELRPGDPVVLYCRVSTRQQKHRKNLRDQERNLRSIVEDVGGVVVDVVSYVGSGWDSWMVSIAAIVAREHGAKILGETTDRYLRHPEYYAPSKTNSKLQARECDLRQLALVTRGVVLMTVVDPDAPLQGDKHAPLHGDKGCKSFQIKRGQTMSGRKGGRPRELSKKQRRLELTPKVRELRAAGTSPRSIAKALGIPHTTVVRWLKKTAD